MSWKLPSFVIDYWIMNCFTLFCHTTSSTTVFNRPPLFCVVRTDTRKTSLPTRTNIQHLSLPKHAGDPQSAQEIIESNMKKGFQRPYKLPPVDMRVRPVLRRCPSDEGFQLDISKVGSFLQQIANLKFCWCRIQPARYTSSKNVRCSISFLSSINVAVTLLCIMRNGLLYVWQSPLSPCTLRNVPHTESFYRSHPQRSIQNSGKHN